MRAPLTNVQCGRFLKLLTQQDRECKAACLISGPNFAMSSINLCLCHFSALYNCTNSMYHKTNVILMTEREKNLYRLDFLKN